MFLAATPTLINSFLKGLVLLDQRIFFNQICIFVAMIQGNVDLSTTGSVKGANFLATEKLLSVGEQNLYCSGSVKGANLYIVVILHMNLICCSIYISNCDITDKTSCYNGCIEGLMTNAYNHLIEAGGLEEESLRAAMTLRGL